MIALLAVMAILVSLPGNIFVPEAKAASSSEIKKQLDALKDDKAAIDAKISELESQLDQTVDEMEAIVGQKNLIDQEIFLLHEQIANTNAQIAAYGVLIADKQEELAEAQAHQRELSDKNRERIRAMEEDGALSYWSVLFKANSFSDLLDRINMIEEIAAADQRRLEDMKEAARLVAEAKASLEGEAEALELVKEDLAKSQETLETKRIEADELLVKLVAKGQEFEEQIEDSEALQDELMKEIANKEDQYDKAKYQEWLATSVPTFVGGSGSAGTGSTVGGVTWLVPISYTRMTSPFGMREHPVYGGYRMHNGVDLAAPQGTPIYATRSGVVTASAYQAGGAGYYVSISHGDGYSSIYMHMTHYIVYAGNYVNAGQVIGYCGSTGGSTGPHLHFGISYNGTYVNPANYIRI